MTELMADQVADTFACELSRIDKLGSNRRLIFTVPSAEMDECKVVVARIVIAADSLPALMAVLAGKPKPATTPELFAFDADSVVMN